jgi:hypothetical protein
LCIKYFDANSFVFGRGKNWIMTKGNDWCEPMTSKVTAWSNW